MNKDTNKPPSKEFKWSCGITLFGILFIGLILLGITFWFIPYLKEKTENQTRTVKTTITKEAKFCRVIALPQIDYLWKTRASYTDTREETSVELANNQDKEKHFQDCIKAKNGQPYDYDFHLINWENIFEKFEIEKKILKIEQEKRKEISEKDMKGFDPTQHQQWNTEIERKLISWKSEVDQWIKNSANVKKGYIPTKREKKWAELKEKIYKIGRNFQHSYTYEI